MATPYNVDPSARSGGEQLISDKIPTNEVLDRAADLPVVAADGSSRPFKTLYSGEGVAKRVLVVFVRHFFCSNCQEYVRTLAQFFPPEDLLRLPVPTSISVVGCGSHELIPMYIEETQCLFPIYSDPSRELYTLLGMSCTLSLGNRKPDYVRSSMLQSVVTSVMQGIRSGTGMMKGGDIKQVGGEFMFHDGKVVWCHHMKKTRDHTEIPELRRILIVPAEEIDKRDLEGPKS